MQELVEISRQQAPDTVASSTLEQAEIYRDEPLASLFAARIQSQGNSSSIYHAYPRFSGAALAYCVFRDDVLRLDVFGKTYVVRDEMQQREVALNFPEWLAGAVKTDSLTDNSFPCEVWKLDGRAPLAYLVFWLYPHTARVHAWAVDADGRRRNGFDLPPESVLQFLSRRAGRNVMFAYRLLLRAQTERNVAADALLPLPGRLGELDALTARNADEWGEQIAFCRMLQRVVPNCEPSTRVLERVARQFDEIAPQWFQLPDRLTRARQESLARARASMASDRDQWIAQVVQSANRGQTLKDLLLPEVLSQVPTSRLPALQRIARDVTVRVMTPAEQEALSNASDLLLLIRVRLLPRLSINVALPRAFASAVQLGDLVRNGNPHTFMPVSRIYHGVLMLSDMIASAEIRLRAALRRELGRVPSLLEFRASTGDMSRLDHIVAFGRHRDANNPLMPDPYFYRGDGYARCKALQVGDNPRWDYRKPVAVWRGSTSGRRIGPDNIRLNSRIDLVYHCRDFPELFDAKITEVTRMDEFGTRQVEETLGGAGLLANRMAPAEFQNYMFTIDIDGNANAWGFLEKLALGLCVLKVESPYEQWFYPDLKPWTHYIPVDPSLKDLVPLLREFRSNVKMARSMAENAAAFALEREIEF